MNENNPSTTSSLRRSSIAALVVAIALSALSPLHAGILVGTGDGNDSKPNVLAVINDYNTLNSPDLPIEFELFKKSDDDTAFVFDSGNGFSFFEDAAGTTPVLSETALTSLDEAYSSYTGQATLLYYSVKGGADFNVFTHMAGLNLIEAPLVPSGSPAAISHVSFWATDSSTNVVPEPSSCVSLLLGGIALMLRRRN